MDNFKGTRFVSSVKDATAKLVKIIDESTRDGEGGQFVNLDGTRIPW
jgi:hypothetical protein